jgi:hypothetical protein
MKYYELGFLPLVKNLSDIGYAFIRYMCIIFGLLKGAMCFIVSKGGHEKLQLSNVHLHCDKIC